MAVDPTLVYNPFAALSFIAAPAILTNASSVLALSTSNRFMRASDRMRALADRLDRGVDSEATKAMLRTQVARVGRQVVLLLRGLGGAYVAIGSFASGSLISIVGAALGTGTMNHGTRLAIFLAMIVGIIGVSGLVFACFNLFRATYLSMLNITEEAALINQRHETTRRDEERSRAPISPPHRT